MIVSGILWSDHQNKIKSIKKLQGISQKLIKFEENTINKPYLTLITGKISQNDHDILLKKGNRILIGRVFDKKESEAVSLEKLERLDTEDLSSEYWGKYLFISSQSQEKIINILRDPTGQMPFFYSTLPGEGIIFSSELSVLYDFLPDKPTCNWSYITSYILHDSSNSTQTPLEGIYELPPGCSLNYEKNKLEIEVSWNPASYCQSKLVEREHLVHVLQSSLKAWHSSYHNIFLSLSGGLDSTSLLYCLNKTKGMHQTLKAVNFFHPEIQRSNEVTYAQKVCDDLNVELIKVDLSETLPFSPAKGIFPTKPNKPFPALTHLSQIERTHEIINSLPSSLLISGHGGDHIFLAPPPKILFSDYVLDVGLNGAKFQLEELARYYRTSFYQILKYNLSRMFCYYFLSKKSIHKKNEADWITKEFRHMGASALLHPMYQSLLSSCKIGKYTHIQTLDQAFASIALDLVDHNPVFYPLLYQPIVELALSIPIYKSLQKGYDRYPLRDAISKTFNTNHVWRRSKGETSGVLQLGLKKNLNYIKILCLEGQLAKQGLVKRDALERHITAVASGENISIWILMNLISTEIFLTYWK